MCTLLTHLKSNGRVPKFRGNNLRNIVSVSARMEEQPTNPDQKTSESCCSEWVAAEPCKALNGRTRTLNWILNLTRSRSGEIGELLGAFLSSLTAAFWTICEQFREALL